MNKILKSIAIFVLIGGLYSSTLAFHDSNAITWFPKDFTCPIDNEKNTFMVIGSYGSYIYSYPSKYQWLFFPRTASNTFYMCKKCHLATYMWDFDKIPKGKIPALRTVLRDIKVSKEFKKYTEIPVSERLEVMEKVYKVLGKKKGWWENFNRVKGYHYGQEGHSGKASEARKKSLGMIQAELDAADSATPKKILYYISASMKHFLGDDKGSIGDLEKARYTVYDEEGADAEKNKNAEAGLNERIKDYIERINGDKKPRMTEKKDGEH